MQEKVSIMCSWCEWENPSLRLHAASLVTAYATLPPWDGFSHPHQEHMKDTYTLTLPSILDPVILTGCYKLSYVCHLPVCPLR